MMQTQNVPLPVLSAAAPFIAAMIVTAPVVAALTTTLACRPPGTGAPAGIDANLAAGYFDEARRLCERDDGALWGVSLCGPMLFVDSSTRDAVANRPDAGGLLAPEDRVFRGRLPDEMNLANTAVDWAGDRWTMVLWPLPGETGARATMMLHELWHRVQDDLGLPGPMPSNAHLDSRDGRIWLRLEWRALRRALLGDGETRRRAIDDALTFRARRRRDYPGAAGEERALEMNEGLAAYTGLRLNGRPAPEAKAAGLLEMYDGRDSLVRSFAYASGPAYGLLLDDADKRWRDELTADHDLGDLLRQAAGIKLPADLAGAAERAAARHDGPSIRAAEEAREAARQERLAGLRTLLIDGPILKLPLRQMDLQFDPNALQPLGAAGMVYSNLRIVDRFGILTVAGSALMHPAFDQVDLPAPSAPESRPLTGEGWTLELEPGWSVVPGERSGDFTLQGGSEAAE